MRAVSPIFTTIIASSSSSRSDGATKATETFLARRVSRSCASSSSSSSSSFFSSSSSFKVLRHASGVQNRRRRHHRQNTFAGLQSSSDTANEGIETNDETEEDAPWAKPGYKGAWVSQQDNQTQILVVTAIWVGLLLSLIHI